MFQKRTWGHRDIKTLAYSCTASKWRPHDTVLVGAVTSHPTCLPGLSACLFEDSCEEGMSLHSFIPESLRLSLYTWWCLLPCLCPHREGILSSAEPTSGVELAWGGGTGDCEFQGRCGSQPRVLWEARFVREATPLCFSLPEWSEASWGLGVLMTHCWRLGAGWSVLSVFPLQG